MIFYFFFVWKNEWVNSFFFLIVKIKCIGLKEKYEVDDWMKRCGYLVR